MTNNLTDRLEIIGFTPDSEKKLMEMLAKEFDIEVSKENPKGVSQYTDDGE